MSKKYNGNSLPSTDDGWGTAIHHYQTVSIHKIQRAHSASEITVEQFLSLKVLWPDRRPPAELSADKVASLFGSSKLDISKAKKAARKHDPAWNKYLEAITATHGAVASGTRVQRRSKFSRELGVFALVLQSQLEASKIEDSLYDSNKLLFTPLPRYEMRARPGGANQDPHGKNIAEESRSQSQGSQHPSLTSKTTSGARYISPTSREEALDLPVGDEQIVNTAAINFLHVLFIHDSRLADWSLQKKQFRFKSDFVKFEARTDGHFQPHGQERSAAILEVKPRARRHELGFRIEMQESAQMALWIYQEPNSH
jgi:hypothetical protein